MSKVVARLNQFEMDKDYKRGKDTHHTDTIKLLIETDSLYALARLGGNNRLSPSSAGRPPPSSVQIDISS